MSAKRRARIIISSFGELMVDGVKAPFRCDRKKGTITFIIKNRHLVNRRDGDRVIAVPLTDLIEAVADES